MLIKKIIIRFVIFIIALIALFLLALVIYNETPVKKGEPTLYFPSSDINAVVVTLKSNGYNINSIDQYFMQYLQMPQEGWYRFDGEEMSRFSFLKNLHTKKAKTIHIVVFAGDTIQEMIERLAHDLDLNPLKLERQYNNYSLFKEAGILAGRYEIARPISERVAMEYLVNNSYQTIDLFAQKEYGSNYTYDALKNTIILASVIQKESNNKEEMQNISSVIHNRLDKNMRLQMDGTLNYGKYARTIVTSERIKSDTSRYNTYKYKGLPPEPLSIVSMEALEAAIYPSNNNYLFFVLDKDGGHVFADNYKEHLENVREFKEYLKEKKRLEELALEANETNETNDSVKIKLDIKIIDINRSK